MVALPRAFLTLGAALGTAMLALVALLVLHSMGVLVDGTAQCSAGSAEGGSGGGGAASGSGGGGGQCRGITTYRGLARAACGWRVGLLAQASVICFCFGFCVVNLVVLADIVRGNPPAACNGLACLLTGATSGVLEDRAAVLLLVAWGAAAPLLLLRSMHRLTALNWAGIGAALGLAALAVGLGASALARGAAHAVPWLPPLLSSGGGGNSGGGIGASTAAAAVGASSWHAAAPPLRRSLVAVVVDAVGVLAVVLTSYVAHQAVHPAMPLLRPYTPARMRLACAAALALSFAVYAAFALGACLAFGPALHANALSNFSVQAMAPLLGGERAAHAVAVALLGAYFVTILSSFVLFVHPLRTSVAELIWDSRPRGAAVAPRQHDAEGRQAPGSSGDASGGSSGGGVALVAAQEARYYLALTYGILAAAVMAAIVVPDIWQALSVIGNGAASVEAFIVPGLLSLALLRRSRPNKRRGQGLAWLLLALGCGLLLNGAVQQLLAAGVLG